jgi:predicted TIM-barrel fold metal-dependent hydrolase
MYKDYLEKRLHPAFDEYMARQVYRWSPSQKTSFFPPEIASKFWNTEGYDPSRGTAVTWDAGLRVKALDQAMIACDVLIPDDLNTNDPPWGSGLAYAMVEGPEGSLEYPAGLVRAGARAYNRWMADFCSSDRQRLRGVTILGTLDNVVWCVDEIHRAYESGLRTAVMLPLDYYLPLLHHRRYDILWEACSELDLPVISHIGKGYPHWLGEDPAVQFTIFGYEIKWHTQRPIWSLIIGGVLERYPDLRLVVAEAGVEWVAQLLQGLDGSVDSWAGIQASHDVPDPVNLSIKPSEYWRRQCYVVHSTFQRREEFEGEAFDQVPNMVFGADVGHHEGWWPVFGFSEPKPQSMKAMAEMPVYPVEDAAKAIWGGLPASKMLPYLEDNFFKAFPNVDRAGLQDVVDRIGPTAAELGLV